MPNSNSHFQIAIRLKEKMLNGTAIGVFSKTTDSSIVEAAGIAGLDFIILDLEHGQISTETLANHIRASLLTGMAPIVRVKGVDSHAIASALDMGAVGVQVPNVETVEDAIQAVTAARFQPDGMRGVCRFVRGAEYGHLEKNSYFSLSSSLLLILQVEGINGVKNLDEILKVDGYDMIFIGPYDLSQSVGLLGSVDSPEVQNLISQIIQKVQGHKTLIGSFCDDINTLQAFKKLNISYLAYSVDINIYLKNLESIIGNLNL